MQTQNEKAKITQMMDITIDKIREMGDVKTVIGDPIQAGDTTIIPVSKVSYGFASGGSDLPAKQNPKELFGGGAGAGVTVQPVAFLIINKAMYVSCRSQLRTTRSAMLSVQCRSCWTRSAK